MFDFFYFIDVRIALKNAKYERFGFNIGKYEMKLFENKQDAHLAHM